MPPAASSASASAPGTPASLPRELGLLVVLASLWAASYTFIRIAVTTIPPITLIAARTVIAGTILLAILHWRGESMPRDRQSWRKFLFQACFNSVIPFTLIAWGQQTTSASLATILGSTSPIFIFLLTVLVTRHESVTGRKLFGVLAGIAGICLIVGYQALGGLGLALWSQLAILVSALSFGVAAIYGRRFQGMSPLVPAAGSLLAGAAVLIPFSLVIDRPWTLHPSAASIAALLGLSVFSTALAFVVYFRLLQTLGSLGTSAQAYLRVPIGVALGVLLLGEQLPPSAWLGLLCVLAGVVAMTLPARPR